MTDLDHLDTIESILLAMPTDHACNPQALVDDGFRLSGALIVGQFVGPDGQSTAMAPWGVGNMNAWTQEGIHAWALRRLADGDYSAQRDEGNDE